MVKTQTLILAAAFCVTVCPANILGESKTTTVTTNMPAITAYDEGFAYDVMRSPGNTGVMLNDMVLLENDGPGSGRNDNGTYLEEIYRGILVRKTIRLDDPAAREAHLVLFMGAPKETRYYIIVNGTRIEGPPASWHEGGIWRWVNIPVGLLRKGENSFVLGCDAPKGEGCSLFIAREEEYEAGGGKYTIDGSTAPISAGQVQAEGMDEPWATPVVREVKFENSDRFQPISVGKNSAKSTDGGKTWVNMKLGPTNDVVGEYTARLNLRRYKPVGKLLSGPIDLWDGIEGMHEIKSVCNVTSLQLSFFGKTPKGTSLTWQARFADTPDMMNSAWGEFKTVGTGETGKVSVDANGKRYLQWRAILVTHNPLETPVAREVSVEKILSYTPLPRNTFYVWKYENVKHRYSSVIFHYEKWDEPKLNALRDRLKIDEVLRGATGDFEKINRLRHHVSQLWHHGNAIPNFPEWNALQILDRRDKTGIGGYCLHFTTVFIQSLLSLGYQARHVNIFSHETTEVYVDELGHWVVVDPESVFDSYEYDATTGSPLSILEQHSYFLKEYGFSPKKPIDWQATAPWPVTDSSARPSLDISTFTGWMNDPSKPDYPPQHRLAGFIRMMPRNDYFSRPFPRPLEHGMTNWPWNGYVNWYDGATPRKLQYSLHTDRMADFYPTLNRVQFSAVQTGKDGEIGVEMFTFTPNFAGFEINRDGRGWESSPASFVWKLRPSAVNTLEMRVRNKLGVEGKPSSMQVLWNYKAPFQKKDW